MRASMVATILAVRGSKVADEAASDVTDSGTSYANPANPRTRCS
jgi:hypothetical protein